MGNAYGPRARVLTPFWDYPRCESIAHVSKDVLSHRPRFEAEKRRLLDTLEAIHRKNIFGDMFK